jgi:hypothetical protein
VFLRPQYSLLQASKSSHSAPRIMCSPWRCGPMCGAVSRGFTPNFPIYANTHCCTYTYVSFSSYYYPPSLQQPQALFFTILHFIHIYIVLKHLLELKDINKLLVLSPKSAKKSLQQRNGVMVTVGGMPKRARENMVWNLCAPQSH